MKHAILFIGLIVVNLSGFCQSTSDFQSHQSGNWNVAATWEQWNGSAWITPASVTPTSSSGIISIQSNHIITITASVSVDQVTVNSGGNIIINSGRTLTIAGAGINLTVVGTVSVAGTLTTTAGATMVSSGGTIIRQQGSAINSSFSTLFFQAGGVLEHQVTSASTALSAGSFDPASTLLINGFTGTGTFNSVNWSVPLGNVIYDCPNQTSGSVNFAGFLRNIQGDMNIRNTGSTGRVYFNSTDTSTLATSAIYIGGRLSTSGVSRLFLTSTGKVEVFVAQDFISNPDPASGASQSATSGSGTMQVGGNTIMNSGTWDFSSSSGGIGMFNLKGNFSTTGATITLSGGGNAHASLNLDGTLGQILDPSGIMTTSIDVTINNPAGVFLSHDFVMTGMLRLSYGNLILPDVSLTLNGPIIQTGGFISSDLNATPKLVIAGSGSLPADFIIAPGTTFDSFEFNRSTDTLATSSDFGIHKKLTVSSGTLISNGVIIFSGYSTISGSGIKALNTIVIETGDTLSCIDNLSVHGNLTNNGTIHFAAGTVTFDGPTSSINGTALSTSFFMIAIDSGASVVTAIPFKGESTITVNGVLMVNHGFDALGSLTVSSTGSLTVNDFPFSVGGAMTVSSPGVFIANGGADGILSGNLSVNGSYSTVAATTFFGITTMTGTGSKTFNDILLTGVLTPNAAYTITGDLTLSGTGILNVGNNTTTFGGLHSIFSNTGNGSATFNRITINAGSKLTANSPFSANGTFTARGTCISNNGFIALGALRVSPTTGSFTANNSPFSIGGTLTVSSQATFVANPGADAVLAGNLSITGTLTLLSSVTFSGTTTMTGSGTKTFSHVIITGSFTPNSAYKISGPMDIAGTLNAGNNTTTILGSTPLSGDGSISFNNIQISAAARLISSSGKITITGNLVNDGIFDPNGGSVTFAGNTTKLISSSVSSGTPMEFDNIILEGGTSDPDLIAEKSINLYGALKLNSTTSNASFDVDGISGNRIFTLQSVGDNPTSDASIAAMAEGTSILGKFTVQRYVSGEGRIYRYICSPVAGATVADWKNSFPITGTFADPSNSGVVCGKVIKPLTPSLYYYGEPTKDYIAFPVAGLANANPLIVGRGYAAFIRQCVDPTVISVEGTLVDGMNWGIVNLPVTHTGTVSTYNNLVGNPYPSAIDWDSVKLNQVSTTIAVRDNGNGVFLYYTQGGIGANDIPNGIIAQGQAFWVRTTGADPVTAVTENSKVQSSSANGNIFYRQRKPDLLQVVLSGSTQTQTDKTYVLQALGSSASTEMDNIDAPKLNNQLDDPFTELFDVYTTVVPDKPLAINALPSIACNTRISLGVKDASVGRYDFTFIRSGVFSDLALSLFDRFLGQTVDMGEDGLYSFLITSDTASQSRQRFEIIFDEKPIAFDLTVEAGSYVCGTDSGWVKVSGTQAGMHYVVATRDRIISDTISGEKDSIYFVIPSELLTEGENDLTIRVMGICGSFSLNQRVMINRYRAYKASVSSDPHCQAGPVILKAKGAPTGGGYNWYSEMDSRAPVFTGVEFITPVLQKTQQYFVGAIDSLGYCEGNRVGASAVIIRYEDAVITQTEVDMLQSNHETSNHWYLNGALLVDTTTFLKIQFSGVYGLEVRIGSCITSDEKTLVVTGTEENNHRLKGYPNPVTGMFYLETPDDGNPSEDMFIFNSTGRKLGMMKLTSNGKWMKGQFDFSPYSPGLYFIYVGTTGGGGHYKIIKK